MIIEVATLYVVLAASPERCGAGEHTLRLESGSCGLLITAGSSRQPAVVFGRDLESAVAEDLALVHHVRNILLERADTSLLVWIAVDNPTSDVREKIFQKELSLIEGFPEVDFDFNIIFAKGRDPREFASGAKVVFSRKADPVAH